MIESAEELLKKVRELDELSKQLNAVMETLGRIEFQFEWHVVDYKTALAQEYAESEKRLPAEDIRTAMAVRAFGRDAYRDLLSARSQRARIKARLTDLNEIVAAHRSIVSAAKIELEASEGPQPQWSGAPS